MNTNFKNVQTYVDGFRGYEFIKWLNEKGWDERIIEMFDDIDLPVIQKCWTSILYQLPIVLVINHDKNHKDMEILDNYREIDSLMRIYGARPGIELYFDPKSCELALESNDGKYFPLKDIYDTFVMTQRQEEIKSWDISEEEKQLLIDNMNVVNSRMQQFYITIRIVESRPKYNESVVQSLKEFYKELNKK